jgi:mannose-6-phosphate isomerase-like protein (cupin superfamily)
MFIKSFDPGDAADALAEMQFDTLVDFNSAHIGVFWSAAGGPSPWEMHPDSEELLHVIEGAIEVEVLPLESGSGVKTIVNKGSFMVIPKGCWHRQHMLLRSKEMYLSPEITLHSSADDPRDIDT